MSQQYKGKGFVQITGRNNHMATSLSTITLGNVSAGLGIGATGASQWATSGFDTISLTNHHHSISKFEMYESQVDVLVLSCTLARMRSEKRYGHKVLDHAVVESVTQIDRDKARDIRDYYSKRIMFGKLNEKMVMTKFREDMNRFIHGDGLHFKETDLGMICYLPTFYDYDVQLDEVKMKVTTNQGFRDMDRKGTPRTLGTEVNLTPLKKLVRKNRNREIIQYWFSDDKLNAGVVMYLTKDNPLLHIWDSMFNSEKVLKIKGSFARQHNDDFEYFSVTNWSLQKD